MWKTETQIYNECINLRALDYIKNYENLSIIEYLEFHAGAVLQASMFKMGLQKVHNDFILRVLEETK